MTVDINILLDNGHEIIRECFRFEGLSISEANARHASYQLNADPSNARRRVIVWTSYKAENDTEKEFVKEGRLVSPFEPKISGQ